MRSMKIILAACLCVWMLVACTAPPASHEDAAAPKPVVPPPVQPAAGPVTPAAKPQSAHGTPAAPVPRKSDRVASAAPPKAPAAQALKAPATPQAPKPAPLDLKSLEQRLKDTSAVGVMTKLSLKNQVDDLVAKFRAFHAGERPPTLPQLRPAFELLLMKVLALLQDKDPGLARDIDASREAIWGVLSDHDKFARFEA